MSTLIEVKQKLLLYVQAIAEMLLPQGRKKGNAWIIGNIHGEAGQSLSLCLSGSKAGLWYDFAEGIGGDLLDLWCAVKGIPLSAALEEARAYLNLSRPKPFMAPRRTYCLPPPPKGHDPSGVVKSYLHHERRIPLEILARYRIKEEGNSILFPFYKPDGTLAMVKARRAEAGAKAKPTTAQCEPILFGWQALFPASQPASQDPLGDLSSRPAQALSSSPASQVSLQASSQALTSSPASQAPLGNLSSRPAQAPSSSPASQVSLQTSSQALTSSPASQAPLGNLSSRSAQAPSSSPASQTSSPASQAPLSDRVFPLTQAPLNDLSSLSVQTSPQTSIKKPATQTSSPLLPTQASSPASQALLSDRAFPPTQNAKQARDLVITEGEIDALSLAAYGYPALSLPFGGGKGGKHAWIEQEFDHLEIFEKIYLATDMDPPGEEAALAIANRLGRHRCYRVCLPYKDANDCLTAGLDAATIAQAFAKAKSFAPEGLHRASDYKEKVLELFWPNPEQHVGYSVPYPKLEGKLSFRPAELTLWSGASGAGKSQLLSDCIPHWIAQESRLCLASLEMKGEQSLRRLIKQTGGTSHPTKEKIEQILHFLDHGLILYEHVGKSNVETLLDVFDYCRAKYGCDQFIIDSLMRLGIAADDYTGQEQAVYKIVDWAVLNAVHVHLVAHARKSGVDKDIPGTEDIKGASEIGANAFNIITIWRNRPLEDKIFATQQLHEKAELTKRPGVVMNIAKQRSGDFEGKVGLWFDQQSYRYRCSPEETPWLRRYLADASPRGLTPNPVH
ncbi:toprim domain-containing protein [Bartonella bacilliformis]|uniref:toprim domain-containing protein n=2 Tax=Bartonella bacilliformis TaxID=774 RepID=UPI0007AF218C|nr:toprim domain-containing protein [Bartonella bacilliformis]KZM38103.1 DNA primase [Bartonella bacilliformis]